MTQILLNPTPPRPWHDLFYYPGSFPSSPLLSLLLGPSEPLLLFSLEPSGALILNLLRGIPLSEKRSFKRQLWSGSVVRFYHPLRPYDQTTPIALPLVSSLPSSSLLNSTTKACYLDLNEVLPSESPAAGFEVLRENDEIGGTFRALVEERVWMLEKEEEVGEDDDDEEEEQRVDE